MKFTIAFVVALLASIPAFAQEQASCKAYFQVLRAHEGSPGLTVGLTDGEKRWWEHEGQKKYPGLCLDGSVTSADKPRYLLIWSKSKSTGQASVPPNEVFGQSTNTLLATAPKEWIYQPRWNVASVTIAYVLYNGSLDVPPVHFGSFDRDVYFFTDNGRVLRDAVKFLSQEPVFLPKVD